MNLNDRKNLLLKLGAYISGSDDEWVSIKKRATDENNWFISEFINLAIKNINENFLTQKQLNILSEQYKLPNITIRPKKVGLVMAGNIPLVGFHDLLCVFITGNYAVIKPSSKDEVMITHLISKMIEWNCAATNYFTISMLIPNCDAYIATGNNNSSRYFEYYFHKYPSIIRKNRTSIAILDGNESKEDLAKLADDVFQYFGLGCRNVTKIFIPSNYDFIALLESFKKYDYLANHHKYKNNYDYNLALHILNNKYYMTNGNILLVEDNSPFSRIAQIHYEFYIKENDLNDQIKNNDKIQCVVGNHFQPFGTAQCPKIDQYADNIDTVEFLLNLN